MMIDELVKDSHERARRKGWWEEACSQGDELDAAFAEKTIPEKLMLIVSEVSEALEDYRSGKMGETLPHVSNKPSGFPSELADIVIRVCDLAGALGIDLEGAIQRKAAYNESRPHRHGGKRC